MGVIFAFVVFTGIYLFILLTSKPLALFKTELFSPYVFSYNSIIPSLGHLLILSILAALFSYVFYRYFPLKEKQSGSTGKNYLSLTFFLIIGALIFNSFHLIFSQLISTSNINFETYKVLELNIFSVIGFGSVFLLLLVPVFYLFKIFQSVREVQTKVIFLSSLHFPDFPFSS